MSEQLTPARAVRRSMRGEMGMARYVSGNTARKLNTVPAAAAVPARRQLPREREQYQREQEAALRRRQQLRQRQQRALALDLPYLMILLLASIVTIAICFNYIYMRTTVTSQLSSIENQEKQLEKLRTENNALKSNIDASVDLEEVYRIATQELGMVYADRSQLITFDKTESEYVRQYENIPKY